MAEKYVVVDVETTGLDSGKDRIIELAIVIIESGQIVDTFSSLVNPQQSLKPFITQLTGITQSMVDQAPTIEDLESEVFARLTGDYVLVGHNVAFDKGFLEQAFGSLAPRYTVDTVELAQIAFPRAPGFSLGALARSLSLNLNHAHRASADAAATAELLLRCIDSLHSKPFALFSHLTEFLTSVEGSVTIPLVKRICAKKLAAFPTGSIQPNLWKAAEVETGLFAGAPKQEYPSRAGVRAYFTAGGLLETSMPGFEHRDEQEHMVNQVLTAFTDQKHLVVEAGTGTGKSLAYLIPSIWWAVAQKKRVVVATHTINLQEQIWQKDIPFLQKVLPFTFQAALVKGRSNYLCLRKFFNLHRNPMAIESRFSTFHVYLSSWLTETETGDKAELSLFGDRYDYWTRVMGDADTCLGNRCQYFRSCFLQRARTKSEQADLLVVNHSLVIADIKTENKVLPAYDGLVLDEAHHLEDSATQNLGFDLSQAGIRRMFEGLAGGSGATYIPGLRKILGLRLKTFEEILSQSDSDKFIEYLATLDHQLVLAKQENETFWAIVNDWLNSMTYQEGSGSIRLAGAVLETRYWEALTSSLYNLNFCLKGVQDCLKKMATLLDLYDDKSFYESIRDIQGSMAQVGSYIGASSALVDVTDASLVRWLEWTRRDGKGSLLFKGVPLQVDSILYEHIFAKDLTVVLTSATLAVKDSFQYFRERIGLHFLDADRLLEMQVLSPFDYDSQALVGVINDLPLPNQVSDQEFVKQAAPLLMDLIIERLGRTLILFNSHKMLSDSYEALNSSLSERGIAVHAHRITGGRSKIINDFKENPKAVILGANSFWEGVDLPGELLQQVIIVRLPFESPTVPIFEARAENLQLNGGNPFSKLSVPNAVVKFKQGFGRLIRTKKDKGVVIVLDGRLSEKSYGKIFLKSLPIKEFHKGDRELIKHKVRKFFAPVQQQEVKLQLINNVDNIADFLAKLKPS